MTGRPDFARLVAESFAFLEADGFVRRTVVDQVLVRYESPVAFVSVSYERKSGELDVFIGRWIDVGGERREEAFSLGDVVALSVGLDESVGLDAVGFRGFATYSGDGLDVFVDRLADWTARFGGAALRGDSATFDAMNAANSRRFEQWQAAGLRRTADEAWRQRDMARIAGVYTRIVNELTTVQLRPSELARLRHAERHLGA